METNRMNFRKKYSECSAQRAADAILMLLDYKGISIDPDSFTCSCINALFDLSIINKDDFERLYENLEGCEACIRIPHTFDRDASS